MGDLVKTIRPKKSEIVYIRRRNGELMITPMPENLKQELETSITLRTYRKYLPILFIAKTDHIVRVFRQPKRELFKNSEIFKF